MTDQLTRQLLNKALGLSRPTLTLYPATTGVPGTGVTLLSDVGDWGLYADIIAAKAITEDFWLCQVQYDSMPVTQIFEIEIFNADLAATLLQDQVDATAATVNLGPTNIDPLIYCAPLTQVQGRSGGAANKTINVSLLVATGI